MKIILDKSSPEAILLYMLINPGPKDEASSIDEWKDRTSERIGERKEKNDSRSSLYIFTRIGEKCPGACLLHVHDCDFFLE